MKFFIGLFALLTTAHVALADDTCARKAIDAAAAVEKVNVGPEGDIGPIDDIDAAELESTKRGVATYLVSLENGTCRVQVRAEGCWINDVHSLGTD